MFKEKRRPQLLTAAHRSTICFGMIYLKKSGRNEAREYVRRLRSLNPTLARKLSARLGE